MDFNTFIEGLISRHNILPYKTQDKRFVFPGDIDRYNSHMTVYNAYLFVMLNDEQFDRWVKGQKEFSRSNSATIMEMGVMVKEGISVAYLYFQGKGHEELEMGSLSESIEVLREWFSHVVNEPV